MCDIYSMRLTTPVDRCPRKIHLLLTRKQVICKVLTATLSQTWTHISDNWLNWSKEWFRQSIFQFTQQGIEYQNSGEHILMHPSHISENFVVHLSCNVCSFTRNTSLTSTNGSIWVYFRVVLWHKENELTGAMNVVVVVIYNSRGHNPVACRCFHFFWKGRCFQISNDRFN